MVLKVGMKKKMEEYKRERQTDKDWQREKIDTRASS